MHIEGVGVIYTQRSSDLGMRANLRTNIRHCRSWGAGSHLHSTNTRGIRCLSSFLTTLLSISLSTRTTGAGDPSSRLEGTRFSISCSNAPCPALFSFFSILSSSSLRISSTNARRYQETSRRAGKLLLCRSRPWQRGNYMKYSCPTVSTYLPASARRI